VVIVVVVIVMVVVVVIMTMMIFDVSGRSGTPDSLLCCK
jgi:hypothetical protein